MVPKPMEGIASLHEKPEKEIMLLYDSTVYILTHGASTNGSTGKLYPI